MQEVFEKIIDKIKNIMRRPCGEENCQFEESCCENIAFMKAIEIVKQAAEQYTSTEHINCSSDSSTNGWIPCGERLPDDFMSFEYLTIRKGHTLATITYYCVVNHKWYLSRNSSKEIDVIAWQPLPEPYQPKVCNTSDCAYNTGKDCPAADGCAGYEPKGEQIMGNWKETKCGKCKIQREKPICNSCRDYNKFVPITNTDRIRSMSDEELAMNMMCPNENGLGDIECDKSDNCNCYECLLKWLQSEVEV